MGSMEAWWVGCVHQPRSLQKGVKTLTILTLWEWWKELMEDTLLHRMQEEAMTWGLAGAHALIALRDSQ